MMNKGANSFPLTPSLEIALDTYRRERAFDPRDYLDKKLALLSRYFYETNLRAAVIGVSGGIDSCVTLAILKSLQNKEHSCLKKIVPISMPFYDCDGATGQLEATANAKKVLDFFELDLDHVLMDLGPIHKTMYEMISACCGFNKSSWSQGQLVSNLRTPVLYQIANQLHEAGVPCGVVGTINRDEGGYIGFFGKASDAMVDIQIISDLHKSEVKQLARFLTIPNDLIEAYPTGNTYDGNTDESSFGFSYDFLELYGHYLSLIAIEKELFIKQLDNKSVRVFELYEERLLQRHQHNQHKYYTPAQGLHFDVYPKAVTGGWKDSCDVKEILDLAKFQNLFVLGNDFFETYWTQFAIGTKGNTLLPYVYSIDQALTSEEANALVSIFKQQKKSYAGSNGYPSASGKQLRATTYSPMLASLLFKRMHTVFDRFLYDDGYQPIDGGKQTVWRLKGFSPVFRFIAYESDGDLIGHYDEGFVDGCEKTLFSVIFYLTTQMEDDGGETVILMDKERNKPLSERRFVDDSVPLEANEILLAHRPKAGNALALAHRIKHGVTKNKSNESRIVLRADLVYERLGPRYSSAHVTRRENITLKAHECLRDVFYRSYYLKTGSQEKLVKAGFIEQACVSPDLNHQARWSILPLMKLHKELATITAHEQDIVVLLSTGGFCPLHDEHFMLMSKAKLALEKQNKKVIAGFFSPSHPDYIKSKPHTELYCAKEHIDTLSHRLAEHGWLDIWLWEFMENNKPINFTDVILRLESELAVHIKTTRAIKVAYVFGGDNAHFAYAFMERGMAVCLSRPGSAELFTQVKDDPLFLGNDTIFFIENENPLSLSSKKIRKTNPLKKSKRCHTFYLRDDNISCQLWQREMPTFNFIKEKNKFLDQLVMLFYTIYRPQTLDFTLKVTSAKQQISFIEKMLADKTILSLDPCYKAEFNLGISRCFRFGLPEIKLGYIARPESDTLEKQMSMLPKQPYCLVDDDSHSGKTIQYIKQLLAEEHVIAEHYVSTQCTDKNELEDIGDLRDFIIGAYQGGLVIRLPNQKIARVPYIYPYVLPSQRYQCPPEDNLIFSLKVWELNKEFFSGCAKEIKIKHCDTPFINLTNYLGFSEECSLYDFCDYHAQQFGLIMGDRSP